MELNKTDVKMYLQLAACLCSAAALVTEPSRAGDDGWLRRREEELVNGWLNCGGEAVPTAGSPPPQRKRTLTGRS